MTQGAVKPAEALAVVGEATHHKGHEYWPLDEEITGRLKPVAGMLHGHQQWTDAALLDQAKGGVLVTLDTGLKQLAERIASGSVVLLRSG